MSKILLTKSTLAFLLTSLFIGSAGCKIQKSVDSGAKDIGFSESQSSILNSRLFGVAASNGKQAVCLLTCMTNIIDLDKYPTISQIPLEKLGQCQIGFTYQDRFFSIIDAYRDLSVDVKAGIKRRLKNGSGQHVAEEKYRAHIAALAKLGFSNLQPAYDNSLTGKGLAPELGMCLRSPFADNAVGFSQEDANKVINGSASTNPSLVTCSGAPSKSEIRYDITYSGVSGKLRWNRQRDPLEVDLTCEGRVSGYTCKGRHASGAEWTITEDAPREVQIMRGGEDDGTLKCSK